jgi:hypothetical protein
VGGVRFDHLLPHPPYIIHIPSNNTNKKNITQRERGNTNDNGGRNGREAEERALLSRRVRENCLLFG